VAIKNPFHLTDCVVERKKTGRELELKKKKWKKNGKKNPVGWAQKQKGKTDGRFRLWSGAGSSRKRSLLEPLLFYDVRAAEMKKKKKKKSPTNHRP